MDRITDLLSVFTDSAQKADERVQEAARKAEERHEKTLRTLVDVHKEKDVKLTGVLPKLQCKDADGLKHELKELRRFFDDAHTTDKRTWFRKIRPNCVKGSVAEIWLEFMINHDFGGEDQYRAALNRQDNDVYWESMWSLYETNLKRAVGLSGVTSMAAAQRALEALKLPKSASPKETGAWIHQYVAVRGECCSTGLIDDLDEKERIREIESFKGKIEGSELRKHLDLRDDFPEYVCHPDQAMYSKTLIAVCLKWVLAHTQRLSMPRPKGRASC